MDAVSFSSEDYFQMFVNDSGNGGVRQQLDNGDYQFDRYRASLVAAYCVLLVVGVCCNLWVALVIGRLLCADTCGRTQMANVRQPDAPKPLQIFILALCCCDLVVLAFLLLLIADLAYGRWILPGLTFICRLYLCAESLNKFCAPYLLVALSGFCYVSICHTNIGAAAGSGGGGGGGGSGGGGGFGGSGGFGGNNRRSSGFSWSRGQTESCLIVICICFGLVFLLITPVYIYGDVHYLILFNATEVFSVTPKCALQPPDVVQTTFTVVSFLCGFVAPAGLFTFFYASIMMRAVHQAKLRTHQRRVAAMSSGTGAGASFHLSRVVKTTLGLVMFYLCCWVPYYVMSVVQYMTPHDKYGQSTNADVIISYIIHMLPYINCSGYPILYTLLNKNITDTYKRIKLKRSFRNHLEYMAHRVQRKNSKAVVEFGKLMEPPTPVRPPPSSPSAFASFLRISRSKSPSVNSAAYCL